MTSTSGQRRSPQGGRRTVVRTTSPTGSGSRLDRRSRMEVILARDGSTCVWCGREVGVGLVEATTEHVVPRIKGGPSWLENEVAACRRCNSRRGHRTPSEWADECDGVGWHPDRERLVRTLRSLQLKIVERGGQRRARPYIVSQLRRLGTGDHR